MGDGPHTTQQLAGSKEERTWKARKPSSRSVARKMLWVSGAERAPRELPEEPGDLGAQGHGSLSPRSIRQEDTGAH